MHRWIGLVVALGLVGMTAQAQDPHRHHGASSTDSADATFASQMMEAMSRMDAGMMAAKPTDDPDRDFAAMMIPHHQGAIDMAKLQLIHGRNPVLRRLAQGIIVEQQQEIEVMQRVLGELSAPQ